MHPGAQRGNFGCRWGQALEVVVRWLGQTLEGLVCRRGQALGGSVRRRGRRGRREVEGIVHGIKTSRRDVRVGCRRRSRRDRSGGGIESTRASRRHVRVGGHAPTVELVPGAPTIPVTNPPIVPLQIDPLLMQIGLDGWLDKRKV